MAMKIIRAFWAVAVVGGMAVSSAHANDEIGKVEVWTGTYQSDYERVDDKKKTGGMYNKISQTIRARLHLNKKTVTDTTIKWEGTATCDVSVNVLGTTDWPGLKDEKRGSDARVIETPASLSVRPRRNKYTLHLCNMRYEFDTTHTWSGVTGSGSEIVPIDWNPSGPVQPEGMTLPEQGVRLSGQYGLPGMGTDDKQANAMFELLVQTQAKMNVSEKGSVSWSLHPEGMDEPEIKITMPEDGEQFVFDGQSPGKLEIEAKASIEGNCDEDATWEIDDIDGSKKSFDPESPSNNVTIRFEELPVDNSSFGEKTITASACGKRSAPVKVAVFFPPKSKNHPGEGSGKTPNWLHYWLQTPAGMGLSYPASVDLKEACPRERVVGPGGEIFEKIEDAKFEPIKSTTKIFVCETLYNRRLQSNPLAGKRCLKKQFGDHQVSGIDYFASVISHERAHKNNFTEWWGDCLKNKPYDAPDESLREKLIEDNPIQDNETPDNYKKWLKVRIPSYRRELLAGFETCMAGEADEDHDKVPDAKESGEGLDPEKPDTCGFGQTDDESFGYAAEYDWTIGSADSEDWSECGKQWTKGGCD